MRFVVILVLACQPYFAVSFLYGAVPAVLRQNGASLQTIGLFGLVFFAFTVNFLWAPIVDRWSPAGMSRRRFWLLSTQMGCILLFGCLAWLDPATNLFAILCAGVALAALAATQRSVILGFCADALPENEQGWGATAFAWGTAVGNVVGGTIGLLLINRFGWSASLIVLASAMLVAMPLLFWAHEPSEKAAVRSGGMRIVSSRPAWAVIAALAPATFGLAVAFAMTQPRLVDIGFDLAQIGAVAAVSNLVAATLAGPLCGWAASRFPLPRLMIVGAGVIALCHLSLVGFTGFAGEWAGALTALVLVFSSICALGIVSNTIFLKMAGEGDAAATEMTFMSAIMSLVALVGFMTSGYIAAAAGYGATLVIAALGSFITALLFCLPFPRRAISLAGRGA